MLANPLTDDNACLEQTVNMSSDYSLNGAIRDLEQKKRIKNVTWITNSVVVIISVQLFCERLHQIILKLFRTSKIREGEIIINWFLFSSVCELYFIWLT